MSGDMPFLLMLGVSPVVVITLLALFLPGGDD